MHQLRVNGASVALSEFLSQDTQTQGTTSSRTNETIIIITAGMLLTGA